MRLLIDSPYLSHRSYSAPYRLTTSSGLDSTLIHTFFRSLFALEKKFRPDEIIFTWESGNSWRRDKLPTYKPRKEYDPAFFEQQIDLMHMLAFAGYPKQYISAYNEADDCIASLVASDRWTPTNIFTVDKDIMQLINDGIPVQIIAGDKIIKEKDVLEKFGVLPNQIPDYLALVGDSSDNIQGIKGIGPKKAQALLKKHKSLDHIPLTREDRETAFLNRQLTRLNKKAELISFRPKEDYTLEQYLDKYELKKLKEQMIK